MTKTVIIPARNSAWCLPECIESIGQQTERPNRVLLGVDACPDTARKALELKAEYNKQKRGRHRFIVDVYWFPDRVGPYRIRNMLAMMAQPGALVFFDADDIMYDSFLETMTANLDRGSYITPRAKLIRIEENDKPMVWDRAHGVISIFRHSFLQHGGFEGWMCAADTEAQARLEAGGLRRYTTAEPQMLVRKHSQGLTGCSETGVGSSIRNAHKQEISRRRLNPRRTSAIAVANCRLIESADELEENTAHTGACLLPHQQQNLISAPEQDAGITEAHHHLQGLLRIAGAPYERKEREIVQSARKYMDRQQRRRP